MLQLTRAQYLAPVGFVVIVLFGATSLLRLNFISHLRVIHSRDGREIGSIDGARFGPATEYEEFGVEDPRITKIGDIFYFTYVAVSRHGVATALASTKDFKSFERHGIIFYPENKDVALRRMTLANKKIDVLGRFLGGQGTINVPCWSPEGRRIAFVTYQLIP